MTWNYRVIVFEKEDFIGLYEVYYDEHGKIMSRTEKPMIAVNLEEGVEGLVKTLEMMLKDTKEREVLYTDPVPESPKPMYSLEVMGEDEP